MTDVIDTLGELGFRASREQIHALIAHLTKSRATPVECVERLADLESRERQARNLESRSKKACIGNFKPVADYDWTYPRAIPRAAYESLMTLGFVREHQNVLIRGPAGVGKTMLAKNIGVLALEAGLTVVFTNLSSALADLLRQESMPAVERRLKRYTSVDLLIADELGYQAATDTRVADLFFQIVSRRHEAKAPVVITTNLPFRGWGPVFPGAACLVPLIDRFTENLVTIDIDGDSYRQKTRGESEPLPPRPAPAKKPTKPGRRK